LVVGLAGRLLVAGEVGAGGAPTLTYATSEVGVIWRRSGCRIGEGPGAKLDAA
jgi:hypothetical protein